MRKYVLFTLLAAAFVPVAAMGQECCRGVLTENGVGIAVRLLGYDDEWEAPSRIYEKDGRFYVKAVPGASYGIELRGSGRRRYEFVISVDGLSVMTGELSSGDERGYIVTRPTVIPGWRRGDEAVARFEFTRKALSYAALTDRPENVGAIGVRVFEEATYEPSYGEESMPAAPGGRRSRGGTHDRGTGYGDEARHPTRRTNFERGECIAEFRLEYASAAMLRAAGVMPQPDNDGLGPVDPFPGTGPFVPPPAGWRRE